MGISSEFLGTSNPGGRSQNPGTGPEVVLANNPISSFFNLVTPEPKPSPYAVGDLIPYGAGFLKYVNIKKNEKNIWVLRLKDQNNKEYSVQIQKQDMPTQSAIRDQLKNTNLEIPSSALFKKPSAPQQPTQQATSQSSSAPKPGDTREADVDPDGAGPQKRTYVSVPSKDGRSFQTRLVKLQAFNGTKWVDQGYGARDIIQVYNQKQRQLTKTRLDLVGVTDRSQAEKRARAWLSDSPQVTGKPRTDVAPQPVETFKTARLAITTGNVALSGPTQARGFIELLDQQVAPDAQRYLQAGNALIGLSGSDLQNFVGVAMDLAPNVASVPGRGNQLLYQGEVLTPIGTVSAALRAAGGEAPRVRPVPVYLRVGANQLAKTVIFRVQGRDGRERIVDNVGRTYDSLENWKQHNQLGAVEVFLPQGGQMTGRDGKVLLEAFNNRRFDNTALPVVRGGVAILGAAAGVAVMLGTGGVAAPLVMAGGAVFSVADSGVTLADRFQHGQTLNLTNQQARAAWLDFGAGLLGAGAIGSGLKSVARASDLADVLTLGNSATDLAIDWNKLSPGERALAGAQLAFWSAMLGASQFSGGRFNLDPLTKPGGGGGGDPNVKPTNPRTDPPPTKKQVGKQVTQQLSPQGIQQLSTQVFSSPDFQTRLVEALKGKEQLASNPAGLGNLAQKVALDAVVKRTFDGSGVPSNVQLNFRLLAEQWAKQQVKKDGGTTAGWLEALVTHNNSSAHRADMLRSSVAQHLGGGNKRLQNAVGAQLGELSEAQLKNLVAPGSGGAPQKAAVTILRDALVNRWAEDFKLSQKQKDQLGANLDQQLQNKKPNTQLEYLRKLDTNAKVRKSLVSDVQNPQGAGNTAVTNPPTQNPPKTPKTVGSQNPNPNPNLNPNTSDITFPPQTIEVILKAISTAGGYEEAMTELKNMAAISDIPLSQLTEIPAVKKQLELLKTSGQQPSNPQLTQAIARLRNLSLNTEGMSNANALTPEQIGQITTAAKAAGSYEKALVVLSDVADVTGIPLNKLASMQSVADVLQSFKTSAQQPSTTIKSQTDVPIVTASLGANDNFLSRAYPSNKKPWTDESGNGYSSSNPALIDAAFTQAKARDPSLQPGPWFRDQIYFKFIEANPDRNPQRNRDASVEAYIARTNPHLPANTAQSSDPQSSKPADEPGLQSTQGNAKTNEPSINRPPPVVKPLGRQQTNAEQRIDAVYTSFKKLAGGDQIDAWRKFDFSKAMNGYLDDIYKDIGKVNDIYAKSNDFIDTEKSIRAAIRDVSTHKQAIELIDRASALKVDAHIAISHHKGRAGDIDDLVPITVAEKEHYERYKAKVEAFNGLIDDLNLRSGDAFKAEIPGWQGEVKVFQYDPRENMLTVNTAAAMDILTIEGPGAKLVERIFGFVGRTGEGTGTIPGMITRRVRFTNDPNSPPPQLDANGFATMPGGGKFNFNITQVDRNLARQNGITGEENIQKAVNYARRWYALADYMMKKNGMTKEEIMFKYAQDSIPNAIGHMNSRMDTINLGGATSGKVVTEFDGSLCSRQDIIKWVIADVNARRSVIEKDPNWDGVPKAVEVRIPPRVEPAKLPQINTEITLTFGALNTQYARSNLVMAGKNLSLNKQNNFRGWATLGIFSIGTTVAATVGLHTLEIGRQTAELEPDLDKRINGDRTADPRYLTAEKRDAGIKFMLNFPPRLDTITQELSEDKKGQAQEIYKEALSTWARSLSTADFGPGFLTNFTPVQLSEQWTKKSAEFVKKFGYTSVEKGFTEYFKPKLERLKNLAENYKKDITSEDPKKAAQANAAISELRVELEELLKERQFAETWLNARSEELFKLRKTIAVQPVYKSEITQPVVQSTAKTLSDSAKDLTALYNKTDDALSKLVDAANAYKGVLKNVETNNKNADATRLPDDVRDKINSEFTPKQTKLARQITDAHAVFTSNLAIFNQSPTLENQTTVVNAGNTLRALYKEAFDLADDAIIYLERQGKIYSDRTGDSNTAIQTAIDNTWKTVQKDAQTGSTNAGNSIASTGAPIKAQQDNAYKVYSEWLTRANTATEKEYASLVSLAVGPNQILLPPLKTPQGQPQSPLEVAKELFRQYPHLFAPSPEAIEAMKSVRLTIQVYQTPEEFVNAVQKAGHWLEPHATPGPNTNTGNSAEPTAVPTTQPVPVEKENLPDNQPTPGANTGF
jgi:hypothetical protein